MGAAKERVKPLPPPRTIFWHRRAIADLLNVPDWQTAARIAADVISFAETGYGEVKRVRREDAPDELRLYSGRWYVRFTYDRVTRSILIERVLRRP